MPSFGRSGFGRSQNRDHDAGQHHAPRGGQNESTTIRFFYFFGGGALYFSFFSFLSLLLSLVSWFFILSPTSFLSSYGVSDRVIDCCLLRERSPRVADQLPKRSKNGIPKGRASPARGQINSARLYEGRTPVRPRVRLFREHSPYSSSRRWVLRHSAVVYPAPSRHETK